MDDSSGSTPIRRLAVASGYIGIYWPYKTKEAAMAATDARTVTAAGRRTFDMAPEGALPRVPAFAAPTTVAVSLSEAADVEYEDVSVSLRAINISLVERVTLCT